MKKIFFVFLIFIWTLHSIAEPVGFKNARNVAVHFYQFYAANSVSDFSVSDFFETTEEGKTTLYTFVFKAGGFVIVSADDAAIPIIGYSFSNSISKTNTNSSAQQWLSNVSAEINRIVKRKASNQITKEKWAEMLAGKFTKGTTDVAPLIKTQWNQDEKTNLLCPAVPDVAFAPGGRATAGCVAISMGQIMNYHQFPAQGIGTKSYIPSQHPEYGTLTANFGTTTYNWALMPSASASATTAAANAVSTLIYQIGVAVNMNYNSDNQASSGANSSSVPIALASYFNYDQTTLRYSLKSYYSDIKWLELLRTELDAQRPFYYSGSKGDIGHAWVCDGYNLSLNTFHFNWGWGGSADGYYAIGALNPSSYSFNEDNNVVLGIKPGNPNLICQFDVSNSSFITGFGRNEAIPIKASVLKGTATKIELWVDNTKITETNTNTLDYSLNTQNLTAGGYMIKAIASDNTGTSTAQSYIAISKWDKQSTAFTSPLRLTDQIFIVDENTVWAKAVDGQNSSNNIREFTKTTNAGTNWTAGKVAFPKDNLTDIANIVATSANKAWACMFPIAGIGGNIVNTTNGGLTWTRQTTADFTNSFANWVYFWNDKDGVCMGDSYISVFFIFTTNDGGTTWNRVVSPNLPAALSGEAGTVNLYSVVGNTIWFGTSSGRVFKSTDKGLTWTVSNTYMGNLQIHVSFKDQNVGFAFGASTSLPYSIKKTINGGADWTTFPLPTSGLQTSNLEFVPGTSSTWVSAGNNGSTISYDDCATFTALDNSLDYPCVKFLNPKTAWIGGYNTSATNGGIFKWIPFKYKVTFVLKDSKGAALPDVSFDFNGTILKTDANGSVSFFDVVPGKDLMGYYSKSTVISGGTAVDLVNADITKNLVLWMTAMDENMDANISVFPNPASNYLRLTNANGYKCQIYNLSGQKINENFINSDNMELNISKIGKGNYILRLSKNEKTMVRKFEIIK